jgi:hypothetical protein
MADDPEKFLSRWSRRKSEVREQARNTEPPKPESPADAKAPPPELPPVEKLDFDSDYRGFFHPKVDEDTRRAALKKLFSDARFNVIDEMDIDIEDYSKYAPLSAAVVASLKQTQNILQWAREREEEEKRKEEEQRKTRLAEEQTRLGEHPDAQAQAGAVDAPAAEPGTLAGSTPQEPLAGPEDADAKKA